MQYINDFDGASKSGLSATLGLVRRLDVSGVDVAMLDVENTGTGAVTGFKLFGRAAPSAPMRDITPVNWTSESALLWQPSAATPTNLTAGAAIQFGLNVTAMYEVELHASGAGAVLGVAAGAYKVLS